MKAASRLVALLLGFCAMHGVAPDTASGWGAWKTFKAFARAAADVPDPGVSVQLRTDPDAQDRLVFLRQELTGDGEWLSPTGAVVWELAIERSVAVQPRDIALWTLDYNSFDDFVDAVEQHETLSRLLAQQASNGWVYWEPCDGVEA